MKILHVFDHSLPVQDGYSYRSMNILFRTGDVQSLVDVVNHIASNRDKWNRIQVAGRQFIEKERTWAASVSRYVQVYNSVQAKSVRG